MVKRAPNTAAGKAASSRNALKPCPACPEHRRRERPGAIGAAEGPVLSAPGQAGQSQVVLRGSRRDHLRSGAPVIPGFEKFEDWERHRAGIIAAIQPEGALETAHAERIASLDWRLKRVPRYETEMMTNSLDDIGDDLASGLRYGKAMGIVDTEAEKLDNIAQLVSRRMLPSSDDMEKIMRGACPERGRREAHLHRQLHQTLRELEALQARRKGERPSPLARLDVAGSPV